MPVTDCPLPEVAEQLGPYIKTRQEVAAIRQGLQRHLQTQTRKDNVSLTRVNLSAPGITGLGAPSSSLTGIRRAYWKALEAHHAAQAKYDALRGELEQLRKSPTVTDRPNDPAATVTSGDEHISLLRQREKLRKLQVLDRALRKISPPNDSTATSNLDDMIKTVTGEPPVPPTTQPSMSRDPGVDAKIAELKKAVVSTKRRHDERTRQAIEGSFNETQEVSAEAEVAGLQNALQELTTWMETQLTTIADAEANIDIPQADADTSSMTNGDHVSSEDIDGLYSEYLEVRRRLVHSINTASEPGTEAEQKDTYTLHEFSATRNKSSNQTPAKSTAIAALPFIPALLAAKAEEQARVQQSAYLRKQLSSAEDETARMVQRLADESHLVQPGASQGRHWADAATDVGESTTTSVRDRLQAGAAFAQSAEGTHDAITNLEASLAR